MPLDTCLETNAVRSSLRNAKKNHTGDLFQNNPLLLPPRGVARRAHHEAAQGRMGGRHSPKLTDQMQQPVPPLGRVSVRGGLRRLRGAGIYWGSKRFEPGRQAGAPYHPTGPLLLSLDNATLMLGKGRGVLSLLGATLFFSVVEQPAARRPRRDLALPAPCARHEAAAPPLCARGVLFNLLQGRWPRVQHQAAAIPDADGHSMRLKTPPCERAPVAPDFP